MARRRKRIQNGTPRFLFAPEIHLISRFSVFPAQESFPFSEPGQSSVFVTVFYAPFGGRHGAPGALLNAGPCLVKESRVGIAPNAEAVFGIMPAYCGKKVPFTKTERRREKMWGEKLYSQFVISPVSQLKYCTKNQSKKNEEIF